MAPGGRHRSAAARRAAALHAHLHPRGAGMPAPAPAPAPASGGGPLPGHQLERRDESGYVYSDGAAGALTRAQRDFYEENGYLVVRQCVPPDALDAYRSRFLDVVTGKAPVSAGGMLVPDMGPGGKILLKKSEGTVRILRGAERDPVLSGYASHPALLPYVRAFCGAAGAKTIPMTLMLLNKPPDTSGGASRHPPHQDLYSIPFRPASRIVAAWTAVDESTQANGCLVVAPGTHRGPLIRHAPPGDDAANFIGMVGVEGQCDEASAARLVPLEMGPGDTVFFSPLLHHGSGRNSTAGFRKAMCCHWVGTECALFDPTSEDAAATHKAGRGTSKWTPKYYVDRMRKEGGPNAAPVYGAEMQHPGAI